MKTKVRAFRLEALEDRFLLSGDSLHSREEREHEFDSISRFDTAGLMSQSISIIGDDTSPGPQNVILAATDSRDPVPLDPVSITGSTLDKPQSKVWEHGGNWWTVLATTSGTHLFRLDGTSWTQVLQVSTNNSGHVDAKVDGDVTHVLLYDGEVSKLASLEYVTGSPGTYQFWAQRPALTTINLGTGVETATLDIDSTGRMWVASDETNDIEVRYSDSPYTTFGAPIKLATNVTDDDICAVTALPDGTVGVIWSNQNTQEFNFRFHLDSALPEEPNWSALDRIAANPIIINGTGFADDHVNVAVSSNGTMYVAVKTGYTSTSLPTIGLLVRRPTGDWEAFREIDTAGTRPIVVLNDADDRLLVIYTASNVDSDIVFKESLASSIQFGNRQTLLTGPLNNVSSIKDNFTDDLVLIASTIGTMHGVLLPGGNGPNSEQPQVNAGTDFSAVFPLAANLNGVVTDDDSTTATWLLMSGPGTVRFGNATSLNTTATFSDPGSYVLRLIATDGQLSAFDEVTVRMIINQVPQVNAGPDQQVDPGNPALLDGTLADEGLPNPPGFVAALWTKTSGPGDVIFADASLEDTEAFFSQPGTYVLTLTGDDGQASVSDSVTIFVGQNEAPVVTANSEALIVLPALANLDGTANDDGLPNPPATLTFTWTKLTGPGDVTFANANAPDTAAAFSVGGTYDLQLEVNDGVLSDTAIVTIEVVQNEAPQVDAELDQEVPFARTADLNGSFIDDGFTPGPFTTTWTKFSGPGTVTFDDGSSLNTTVHFSADGTYVVRLSVSDGDMTGSDDVQITIGQNQAPFVDAGQDRTIKFPALSLMVGDLDGTAADDNLPNPPAELATLWTFVDGPEAVTFGDPLAIDTTVLFHEPGIYVLRLTANDSAETVSDEVTITVVQNQPPQVDAGPDQSILFNTVANLTATVIDDGLPDPPALTTVIWIQISGPGQVRFGNPVGLDTTARFPALGLYRLQVIVNDTEFTVSDDVEVDVRLNQPPIVDAGPGQTILINETAILDGDVRDDNLPNPPGAVTTEWTQISGPGTVTFGDAFQIDTIAQFSDPGTYVLRLMADDGLLQSSRDVTIVVLNNFPLTTVSFQDGVFPTPAYTGTRDATILSNSPGKEQGTLNPLTADGTPDGATLLRWDTSSVPRGTQVLTASIVVNVTDPSTDRFDIFELLRDWNEVQVTWQRPTTGANWQVAGAQGTGDRGTTLLGTVQPGGPGQVIIDFNTSGLAVVQAWIDNPNGNFGVIIKNLNADDSVGFNSSEDLTPLNRPELRLGLVNQPPQVDAGLNQSLAQPDTAVLDGIAFDDGFPDPLTVLWSLVSGPAPVTFGDPNSVDTTVTFTVSGTYVLELSADDGALTSTDRVTISVDTPATARNRAPLVSAGPDRGVIVNTNILLDATVTDDGLPNPPNVRTTSWTVLSGPGNVQFGNRAAVDTTARFSVPGAYELMLIASDTELVSNDTVIVNVFAQNSPPTVEIGAEQIVILPNVAHLDGTVNDEGVPAPTTSTWSQIAGPDLVTFANPAAADTTATFPMPGTYILRLTATDSEFTAFRDVSILVVNASSITGTDFQDGAFPTLEYLGTRDTTLTVGQNAGAKRNRGSSIQLSGVTDLAGLVEWDISSLPAGTIIESAFIMVNVLDETTSSYEIYQLLRDWEERPAKGGTVANWEIGGAQGQSDRGNTVLGVLGPAPRGLIRVNLNDAGVEVIQQWIDNPASNFGFIIQDYNAADPLSFSARETKRANVRPHLHINYINVPPTVDVGADQTVLLPGTAALSGTVADDGLPIPPGSLSTTWSVLTGPAGATIANPASLNTTASFSQPGNYVIRLTANDGSQTVRDDVLIFVRDVTMLSFQDGVFPTPNYAGTRDTTIDSTLVTDNFGILDSLALDSTPGIGTLVKWDISAIPVGVNVRSATMTFDVRNGSPDEYEIYGLLRNWVENEATWNRAEVGQNWQSPGAVGPLDRSINVIGSISTTTEGLRTITLNAAGVALVQSWVDDPQNNYGVAIQDFSDGGDRMTLSSREITTAARRPRLSIQYVDTRPPQPNQAPVVDAGLDQVTAVFATVNLTGSVVDDNLPDPPNRVTTQWTLVSGPGNVIIGDAFLAQTNAQFSDPGTYVLRLTANDAKLTGSDTVTVTVSISESFQDGVSPSPTYDGTRDTRINSTQPDGNFGTLTQITMDGPPATAALAGLIKWDISSIPIDSIIQAAGITIEVTNDSADTYEIYGLTKNWVEIEATWTRFATGNTWELAGGQGLSDFTPTVLGSITAISLGMRTIDLNAAGIALVQAWVRDPSTNYGFIFQDYAEGVDQLTFSSRESTNVVGRPKLTVKYTPDPTPHANRAPNVNAGLDQAVVINTNVSLDATVTDDGLPNPPRRVTTVWTKLDGPGQVTFANPSAVDTTATFGDVGTYVLRLIANDSEFTVLDDVTISITQSASFQDGVSPTPTYTGTRDTKLDSEFVDMAFGTARQLANDAIPSASSLLKWEVDSISGGVVVHSASITLNITNTSTHEFEIYAATKNWSEANATWNKAATGLNWQTAGAQGPTDRGATVLGTINPSALGPLVIPLNAAGLALVQAWIDDPATNYGIAIQDYTTATDRFEYSSRESIMSGERPKLTVNFSEPLSPVNQAPRVDAGADQTLDAAAGVNLNGTVTDDRRPDPPRQVTTLWTKVSGPGLVTFGDATQVDTTAQFSELGTYVLRLSANDSDLTGTDDVTITITSVLSFQDGVTPTPAYAGTRDTRIDILSPNVNLGGLREVGADGTLPLEAIAGLLRWDITAVPAGVTVHSASLTLNITNNSVNTYEIYELKRNWVETEATWNRAMAASNWQTAGAQGSLDRGNVVLGTVTATGLGSFTIQLNEAGIDVVQRWVDEPATNFGFIVQDYAGANDRTDFSSRQTVTVDSRPKFTVSFLPPSSLPENQVPTVEAGADQTVFLSGGAPLSGIVRDDRQPNPPRSVTTIWSQDSGPGLASFDDATATHTTARFSSPGTYVLRLSATDSELSTSDTMSVTVTGNDSFQNGLFPSPSYVGTQDTRLDSLFPTINFGNERELVADSNPAQVSLVKWDISSIPTDVLVQDATITINVTNPSLNGFDIFAVIRDWTELNATWRLRLQGNQWQAAGASGPTDRGNVVLASVTATTTGLLSIPLNAAGVAVVQGWIHDPATNFGIIFASATSSDSMDFSSSEVLDATLRPKLNVAYEQSATPTENQTPMVDAGPEVSVLLNNAAFLNATVGDDRQPNPPARTTASWEKVSGPGTVTFGSPNATDTLARFSAAGDYELRLNVTDSELSASDTVVVHVTLGESFQDEVFPSVAYAGTRDTMISANAQNTNSGDARILSMDGTPDISPILSWDISSLPTGATIRTASITFNVTNISVDMYSIFEMKQNWAETEATFVSFSFLGTWDVLGAQGASDRGATELGSLLATSTGAVTVQLNAAGVAIVQRWLDDPASNYGVILQNYLEATDVLSFSSRESTTPSERPKLNVTYTGGGAMLAQVASRDEAVVEDGDSESTTPATGDNAATDAPSKPSKHRRDESESKDRRRTAQVDLFLDSPDDFSPRAFLTTNALSELDLWETDSSLHVRHQRADWELSREDIESLRSLGLLAWLDEI